LLVLGKDTLSLKAHSDPATMKKVTLFQNQVHVAWRTISPVLGCLDCWALLDMAEMAAAHEFGWLSKELVDLDNRLNDFVTESHSNFRVIGPRATDFTKQEHLELLRDGKAMLERARMAGLLSSWVVARGTMIMAMRYGDNQAVKLPSGYIEEYASRAYDMDTYLDTDDFHTLAASITAHSKELGFTWCGMQKDWPRQSFACLRAAGELEFHSVDKRWIDAGPGLRKEKNPHPGSLSMVPPSRCIAGMGTDADGVLELNCPKDPMGFMQYIWYEQPHYAACLALPMSSHMLFEPITEEDVRFLWQRSLELHAKGFQSMAQYFGVCRDHPLGGLAQSLYWSGWEAV